MTIRPPHSAAHFRPSPSGIRALSPRVPLLRQAPAIFRRHLARDIGRVVLLVGADLGMFIVVRQLIRTVRDAGVLGPSIAAWFETAVPLGVLGGWQFATALIIGLAWAGSYERGDGRRDPGRMLTGVSLASGLALWHQLGSEPWISFLAALGCTIVFIWAGIVIERLAIDRLVERFFPNPARAERVLFVGDPTAANANRVFRKLVERERMTPVGWISPGTGPRTSAVIGGTDDIWNVLQRSLADTVVLCGQLTDDVFEAVVEAGTAAGCRVLAVSRYENIGSLRPGLVWYRDFPFIELTLPSLKARQLAIKRGIDLFAASLGLILLAPLFAVISALIKLDSPGPVFFTQERVGMGGRVFRLVKFRTMREGADEQKSDVAHLNRTGDPRLFKIPDDPRVTRLGAQLRRWSLDELPQLWNVLVGDMSLVGPRPFFESDLAEYSDHHFTRLGAKPGITGLWQVSGRSDVVDFEEVVRLDREYIDQWSLLLDLQILARTIPTVLSRSGAF